MQIDRAEKVKDFKQNKKALNNELDKIFSILDELLPRYSELLKKDNITNEEITELGEIEHYLIEVNSKISELKNMLEDDLFGHSLNVYYKIKTKALMGDEQSVAKLERLRKTFDEYIRGGTIFNWN